MCCYHDRVYREICTLSLHDALPIYWAMCERDVPGGTCSRSTRRSTTQVPSFRNVASTCAIPISWAANGSAITRHNSPDRKSTRLNSSHGYISYAVFCLKKKKK